MPPKGLRAEGPISFAVTPVNFEHYIRFSKKYHLKKSTMFTNRKHAPPRGRRPAPN